jgi:predicted nicotinamide N-methyase
MIKIIFVLIILLNGLTFTMSSKLLIINSNRADVGTMRMKIDPIVLNLHTFQDLHNYIRTLLNLGNENFALERLNNTLGKYLKVTTNDEILWNFNHISVLVIQSADSDNQLCIQGRAFSMSKGLSIGSLGYKLRIFEVEEASLGTGLNIWDGSVVLAKYLETHSDLTNRKHVLELGAGTGLAGIAAGLLGARSVLLTDLDYTLDNLRRNADINFAQMAPVAPMTSPSSVTSSKDERACSLEYRVSALDWADSSTYPPPQSCCCGEDSFDVILGADIVWLEHLVPLLVRTLVACMGENTLLLLSHQVRSWLYHCHAAIVMQIVSLQTRSERTDKLLFESLDQHFVMSKVSRGYCSV